MNTFPDPEIPEDPIDRADRNDTSDDIDRIQQLVKELDLTGGVARIYRQPPGGSEFNYEGEIPVDNFNLETIKRVYGGGRYNIKLTAKGGKYVKGIKVSVDAKYIGERDQPKIETTIPMTPNDSYMARLDAQIERSERNARDHMTLMMGVMQANQQSMLQLVTAIVGNKQPVNVTPPEPASRLLEVMTPLLLQQMTQPRNEGGNNLSQLTEMVKLARELSGNPAPETKEDDMMEKLVKVLQVGAPIVGAFMNRGQAQQQPAIQVNPTPRPHPQQAIPQEDPQQAAAQAKLRELLGTLRLVRPVLIKAAKKNSDIVSYLDIVRDYLDETGMQMLVAALQQPNWMEILFDNDEQVLANAEWFENFRAMVLNPGEEEDDDDDKKEATPQDVTPKATGTPGMVP